MSLFDNVIDMISPSKRDGTLEESFALRRNKTGHFEQLSLYSKVLPTFLDAQGISVYMLS